MRGSRERSRSAALVGLLLTLFLITAAAPARSEIGAVAAPPATLRAQPFDITLPGHLSGTVRNIDGRGLAGITVTAYTRPLPTGNWVVADTTLTVAGGDYDMALHAATYRIRFSDASGGYVTEWYNDKATLTLADGVAVSHLATTGIDVVLSVVGIAGRVRNDEGAGLSGMRVVALRANGSGGWDIAGSTSTTADGAYELGLAAGTYRASFWNPAGDYVLQYYDGKSNLAQADDIVVRAGFSTTGVNATPAAAGHIAGTVSDASGPGLSGVYVYATIAADSGGWDIGGRALTTATGAYDLGGLRAGMWRVWFTDSEGIYATQWYKSKSGKSTADEIAVRGGLTTANINATLVPGGHITGTVRNASGDPVECRVSAFRPDGVGDWEVCAETVAEPDATYHLDGLSTGSYRIQFLGNGYPMQFYNNRPWIDLADEVAVAAGATTSDISATMWRLPTLSSFTPISGPVGTVVILTGTELTGTTKVAFKGASAAFNVDSGTQITATVPVGATSGPVAVTTPGGTEASAASFTVTTTHPAKPTVTLKLTGLTNGATKLGKRITARGKVTPDSLAGERCKLTVQRKRVTRWVTVKSTARMIGATGSYSWQYKPASRGVHRVRAAIAATAAHLAARTPWRTLRVR